MFEAAFICFRIEKDLSGGKVRLKRVKEPLFDSDEKLFALPDTLDEENGPYADLLDHLTRCRVKMLNDLFAFEAKLSVDEVEDEIREDQNAHFIEGKAVHTFEELTAILDYMPAGHETDEEAPVKDVVDDSEDEIPELDEAEEEKLKNDESLKWDEDDGDEDEDAEAKDGDKDKDDDDGEEKEKADDEDEDADEKPRKRSTKKK